MNKRILQALGCIMLTWAMTGCTQQSRDEYKDAGSDLSTGVKTDVNVGAKAVKAAGDAAKKSVQQSTGTGTTG